MRTKPTPCVEVYMADIQSATAEIRRGKKIEEETTGRKYNGLPYSIGQPEQRKRNTNKQSVCDVGV